MDPAPERLQREYTSDELTAAGYEDLIGQDSPCLVVAASAPTYAGRANGLPCRADGAAFSALAGEYGYAIAPTLLHGAHTYGQRSFDLRFESSIATINSSQSYWKLGTEGPPDPATHAASVRNKEPAPVLALYGVRAHKGLPFGFETGAFFGWLGQTSLFVPGVSVRWAPKEGFREDLPGLLPDLSVGVQFRTITGTTKLQAYTTSIDVELSKRIVVANALEFTPYLGGQRLIVATRSGSLDLTPNVDANDQCGFAGYDESRNHAKICSNGVGKNSDFANAHTYGTNVTYRTRVVTGAQVKREHFIGAAELAFDVAEPGGENPSLVGGRQLTFALSAGATY